MSKNKNRLGKGLGAIIPDSSEEVPEKVEQATRKSADIPVDKIKTNRLQPRKNFDEKAMEELRQSISKNGLIQPITVRKTEEGYELIAGERRVRAARDIGMEKIPSYVLPVETDVEMMGYALIENVQREDLNPVEKAEAYKMLSEKFNLSHQEVAERVGKGRTTISNSLRLLDLPDVIQKDLRNGEISAGHARPLLRINDEKKQLNLWRKIKKEGLSVREVEEAAKKFKEKKTSSDKKSTKKKKKRKPAYLKKFEERAMHTIGTKVNLKGSEKKGKLEIKYYSKEDLNRLIEIFDSIEGEVN